MLHLDPHGLREAGELGLSTGNERKPQPFSGRLSSWPLSNKPQRGCRGHPLHIAVAPPTRHCVPDRHLLSKTRIRGDTRRPCTVAFHRCAGETSSAICLQQIKTRLDANECVASYIWTSRGWWWFEWIKMRAACLLFEGKIKEGERLSIHILYGLRNLLPAYHSKLGVLRCEWRKMEGMTRCR